MSAAASMPQSGAMARETIWLAVKQHGHKRGIWLAAGLLGVKPDTARKISTGATSGATVCPITALAARQIVARERADHLRAELRELEKNDPDIAGLGHHGALDRGCRA